MFLLLNYSKYNYTEKLSRANAPFPHALLACERESLFLKLIHGCGNRDSHVARPFVTASSTVIDGEPFTVHCTVFHGSWNRDDNF